MSIQIIKEQIDSFIATPEAEVLAIKGDWGVGKTFAWNKFLLQAKNEDRISFDKYSYVSLFGINSLDSFKFSIFENIVDTDILDKEANLETFQKNSKKLVSKIGRAGLGIIKSSTSFNSVIESISFLSLNKILICIDDLERSGTDLSVKDILGLASQLKEQKKCKIVFLLNDGECGLGDYDKYKEKVIDVELNFSPTPEECADIAFDNEKTTTAQLKYFSNKLRIKNIRVLKKIERMVDLAIPLAEGLEDKVEQQVIQSLTLFSWCHYCSKSDNNIPPIDFVTNLRYSPLELGKDKNIPDTEKPWRSTLVRYDYELTDELDLVLADSVKRGYFISDEFSRNAKIINDRLLEAKSRKDFHDAWSIYRDSFEDNQNKVINVIYNSLKENIKQILPADLSDAVTLFRELDRDDLATEVIDLYIEKRSDEIELFNMKENNPFGDIKDTEIVCKFNEKYDSSIITEDAAQVLGRISGKSSWNQEDEIVLANTSTEDYYKLFKSEKGPHLSKWVNTCLNFGDYRGTSDAQKKIAKRAAEALKRIGAESKINRSRVLKFGIKVNDA